MPGIVKMVAPVPGSARVSWTNLLIGSIIVKLNFAPVGSVQLEVCACPARAKKIAQNTINTRFIVLFIIEYLHEKSSLFPFSMTCEKGIKKRTKETLRSPLFTGITARFARAYARRENVLLDARCE